MNLDELIKELKTEDKNFKYELVEKIRNNKKEMSSLLLDELKKTIDSLDTEKMDVPMSAIYCIFLLAEFEVKEACPLLLKLVSMSKTSALYYLGDGVMEPFTSIMASVYDGNINNLNEIIENKKVDYYTRERVLSVYEYLYQNDMINKDDLIKYLRKLIELYIDSFDGIFDEITDIVIHCHLFEMLKDLKRLCYLDLVDPGYRGVYDDFIDDIFNYDYDDKMEKISKIEDYMATWSYFNNRKEKTDFKKLKESFKEFVENDIVEHTIDYSKIGRNDPCPCGSGKKYKKCCIDKQKEMLPYQKYIDESLGDYPRKNNNKDEVDFYTYFDEEYIKIDKLLYKALKHKRIPVYINRNKLKEDEQNYKYLDEAYPLIKEVIEKNNFKTLEEYDEKVSIHYELFRFFGRYSYIMIEKIKRGNKQYLENLEELIKYFYSKFNISDFFEFIFINSIVEYYKCTKGYDEAIKLLEEKLKTNKHNKDSIYESLFDLYSKHYDYSEAINKMDDLINEEDDEVIKEYLEDLKLDYLDDEYDYMDNEIDYD